MSRLVSLGGTEFGEWFLPHLQSVSLLFEKVNLPRAVLKGGNMRSRIHAAISKDDLCRELGVPSRTLRLAFRKLRGCGPLAFHQWLRLNAVRTRLKQLPADRSVAAIARQWGFHHLGKFAGYYRRLFGELPSETVAGNGIIRRFNPRAVPNGREIMLES
jgi:AraC-like DNA-binding protein